jgi:ornithine cyclodeaminase
MVAAAALGCHSRSRLDKVALIGAGVQGRAQLEALSHCFVIDELALVDPTLTDVPPLSLACSPKIRISNVRDAVKDADIVITATRSSTPVFDGSQLKSNAFVAAIGVSTATGRELDDSCFERAERVIVEWMPQSMQEAGDVLAWLNSSGAERGKIFDLPSLYSQSWPRVDGIQVFKSVGTGLADAACAWLLYQKLKGSWSKSCI